MRRGDGRGGRYGGLLPAAARAPAWRACQPDFARGRRASGRPAASQRRAPDGDLLAEHGFRGTADAGEHVASSVDERTGVLIRSLYDGRTRRPSDEAMRSFDVLLVDMQDVGLRFYTYYISMLRMMDACADFGRAVVVLDRPNPNGSYIDGPVLDMKYKSGVGALPIPVVHGLTMARSPAWPWVRGGRSRAT